MDDGRERVEELTLQPVTVGSSNRRRALWGVLAAVAVATGALVVTSTGDDGATRPGLPVDFGSSFANREASGASADAMFAWIQYVAGDDLPALGGSAPAYRLPNTVSDADVRALAGALGLDGEVVHEGPGWTVRGDAGLLEVFEGGAAQWWYSSTDAGIAVGSGTAGGMAGCDSAVASDCTVATATTVTTTPVECPPNAECAAPSVPTTTVPCLATALYPDECPSNADDEPSGPPTTIACAPGAECVEPEPPVDSDCAVSSDGTTRCPEPVPPADLPSEDEARVIALDLLEAAGVDVDGALVRVEGPYEAWYLTVEPRLDGVPSGLLHSVTVGSAGEVTFASGVLAKPERLGDYPRLDTRATIERANEQSGAWRDGDPAVDLGAPVTGSTAHGDTFDSTGTAIAGDPGDDPCVTPDGASDGCGGTTGSDPGNVDPPATTIPPCKVQPDGSEICEGVEPGVTCPQAVPPADEPLGAPETIECTPPPPGPDVEPVEPEPVEIVLVDAEPSLVLLGAVDGSTDAYLVPAYRFTTADGSPVDLPAVADSELTSPPTTGTSAPTPVDPPPTPTVVPQPCEVLVEEDASGTTHTIQPAPDCVNPDPQTLGDGEEPAIGVGYYVDVDTTCEAFRLGGTVWVLEDGDLSDWSTPHEGGTFTLDAPDHGTFVGDQQATKTATFRLPQADDQVACADPAPRG